jgi:hypothetical protein
MDHQHQKMCEYGNEFIENALYIREHKLYRGIYDTFDDFMAVRFSKTRQWLTQQKNRLKVLNHLPNDVEISLSAAQSLASLPDEEQADAYAEATEKAASQGKERPTTKQVKETVTARKNAKGGEYKPPPKTGPSGEAMLVAGRSWLNSHVTPWINYYDQADECEDAVEQIKQALLFLGTQVEGTEK